MGKAKNVIKFVDNIIETVNSSTGATVATVDKAVKDGIKLGVGTVKVGHKWTSKKLSGDASDSLYERVIGSKANALGVLSLTAGTMALSTGDTLLNSNSKVAKLGNVSVGENLDRLISYDGSGFVRNFNQVTGGNPEVMRDVVKNTFDSPNQFGATGDLVFALHNMREG